MRLETFNEFADRQGCGYVRVSNGVLFENGASSDGFYTHQGLDLVPEKEIPKRRLEYAKALLQMAEKDFAKLKHAALGGPAFDWRPERLGRPQPNPVTNPECFDRATGDPLCHKALEIVRDIVLERREIVRQRQAEHDALPEVAARRRQQEFHEASMRQLETAQQVRRDEVQSITI